MPPRTRNPYRRKRRYRRRRRKKKNAKRGVTVKQIKKIAQVVAERTISKQSNLKKYIQKTGEYVTDPAEYNYGQAVVSELQENVAHFMGHPLNSRTCSIPIGLIEGWSMPSNVMRNTLNIMKTSVAFTFKFTFNPSTIGTPIQVKFGIFSTLNDPKGSDPQDDKLGFNTNDAFPNENAYTHVATNLMRINTDGMTAPRDFENLPMVDTKEFKKHWVKTVMCYPTDDLQEKTITRKYFHKLKRRKESYTGKGNYNKAIEGRRYYLLANANVESDNVTTSNGKGVFMHFSNFTYFRDIIDGS